MCGIAGVIQWKPDGDPRAAVEQMPQSLAIEGQMAP